QLLERDQVFTDEQLAETAHSALNTPSRFLTLPFAAPMCQYGPPMSNGFGIERVIEPKGALPQAAQRLDPQTDRVAEGELVIDVDVLNVDSASFRQIEESAPDVGARVLEIVHGRGKLHNPVTGSGGMLLGRVSKKSSKAGLERYGVAVGDRVATLVSLTLTPLSLQKIVRVNAAVHQVEVEGEAVLFPSGMLAKMPAGLPERMALAALDVAGA